MQHTPNVASGRDDNDKSTEAQKQGWIDFYTEYFGPDFCFNDFEIPDRQPEFDRLVVIARGITLNQVYDLCSARFPCWSPIDDLDAIIYNERDPVRTYAIWVRDQVEAGMGAKRLSAGQLAGQRITLMTLLERMWYEAKYWNETNKHLDNHHWTLCEGSCVLGGATPVIGWRDGRLAICACPINYEPSDFYARIVISLPDARQGRRRDRNIYSGPTLQNWRGNPPDVC